MNRTLTQFTGYGHPDLSEERPKDSLLAMFVDTETTGKDDDSLVVELALRTFAFDAKGEVVWMGPGFDWLQDPGIPIPPEATKIHRITDEMVQGKVIDELVLAGICSQAKLVIAHNAGFDRDKAEVVMPALASMRWACSWKEVPWRDTFGASCGNLGHLLIDMHDQYHVAHRALADCDVGVRLLGQTRDAEGRTALSYLYESMKKPTLRVWANRAPFEIKDVLKKRGYKWHDGERGRSKAWYFDGDATTAGTESRWLIDEHGIQPDLQKFTALDRHSKRMAP